MLISDLNTDLDDAIKNANDMMTNVNTAIKEAND
jgi:hypothetical protein